MRLHFTSGPQTAWGKENVSMLDYRTDGGQCAVLAATTPAEGNGANTAGGIDGQNAHAFTPLGWRARPLRLSGAPPPTGPSSAFPTGAGGAYRDNTNADMVSRAANAAAGAGSRRAKARTRALKSCLVERGYTEFR